MKVAPLLSLLCSSVLICGFTRSSKHVAGSKPVAAGEGLGGHHFCAGCLEFKQFDGAGGGGDAEVIQDGTRRDIRGFVGV